MSNERTAPDDLTARYFGPDKPVELRGPIVHRMELAAPGMICRYLRSEKRGDNQAHVFQLPTAEAKVFSLWNTAQLGGKIRTTRKGEVVLVIYLGQTDDEDKVHQWEVRPFTAKASELATMVRQEPWLSRIRVFIEHHAQYEKIERERRTRRGDDGAPPLTDDDFPFPHGA